MFQRLRSIGIIGITVAAALFMLVSLVGATPAKAKTADVNVEDNYFEPKVITVHVGDTVTWKHEGKNEHTATADGGSFNSDDLNEGNKSYSFTFTTAGTFLYHCKYHGAAGGVGMSGRVVVLAASTAEASPQMPRTGGEVTLAIMLLLALSASVLLVGGAVLKARANQRNA